MFWKRNHLETYYQFTTKKMKINTFIILQKLLLFDDYFTDPFQDKWNVTKSM